MKYYYFKEEWEIADYRYISYFKVTAKSLNWTNKIKDTSEFIPNPSTELKGLLRDTLIHVTRKSISESLILG